jgi:head-tail adaptor
MAFDFSTDDLTLMREAQTDHMMDECYIQALTQTFNSFGEEINSWADSGAAISCGLEMQAGSETREDDKTVVMYDAVLRIAITDVPAETKRIRVTKRHGETLSTAIVYEIRSPIQRGPSGNRILLNKVST